MEGKRQLNSLPDPLKDQIISKYGSIGNFYNMVYQASADYYRAFVIEKNAKEKKALEAFRFSTALELEEMAKNVKLDIDGFYIYDNISGDFDEQLIKINYPDRFPKK